MNNEEPDWAPLRAVVEPDQRDLWMWMGRVEHDGTVIELYKHRLTRGYLRLSGDGQAWRYLHGDYGCGPWCDLSHEHVPDSYGTYEPMPLDTALEWAWV